MRSSASGSNYSYNTAAMQRGQSRGKIGSRPTYESAAAATTATRSSFSTSNQTTNGRSGYEEESKVARSRTGAAAAESGIYVRPQQRSTNTFGDFTGNMRTFEKPEADQISSRKRLDERLDEELRDFGGAPGFGRGKWYFKQSLLYLIIF